ncbi:ABC transporter permease [Microbacterium sp.]|uniref:ABC transporter permease n=1 Tax=Microbacterium sp. TaxID=51671 RepID=UPI003C771A37
MIRYILGRLGGAVVVLFVLSVLVFSMVRLIPGDPVAAFVDPSNPDPEQIAAIRSQLGLDQPPVLQYVTWIGGVLTGDFGMSLTRPVSVTSLLADRMPVSIQLAVMATVIALALGIPAGIWSARRAGRTADGLARGVSFALLAIPPFLLGLLVILLNARTAKLPLIGFVPFAADPLRNLQVMIVPAILLALPLGALIMRYTRGSLLDTFSQDYIRTARAKGVPAGALVHRHAVPNALIPVVTIVGVELAGLVGGVIVTEQVFAIPGIGGALITAVSSSDYPTTQGAILLLGAVYVVINLAVDLIHPLIDPRVRVGKK